MTGSSLPVTLKGYEYAIGCRHDAYLEFAHDQNLPPSYISRMRKAGVGYYHKAADSSLLDLIFEACRKLVGKVDEQTISEIDLIIYSHTMQLSSGAPPLSVVDQIRHFLKLENTDGFSVHQLNCVSMLKAFQVASTHLQTNPKIRNVLIVSADKVLDEALRCVDGLAVESDGASAAILTRVPGPKRITSIALSVDSRFYKGLGGLFEDNGPRPSSPHVLSALLMDAAKASGCSVDQFDWIVPHNGNLLTWSMVMRLLNLPEDRLFKQNIFDKGHFFCSDLIVNLVDMQTADLIGKGQKVLAATIGFGMTYGAVALSI